MQLPEHLKDKNRDELEEWFVESLSADPIPAGEMLAVLRFLGRSGDDGVAREWAELMQEALKGAAYADAAMELLNLRLAWDDGSRAFRKSCRGAAVAVFTDRLGAALVDSVGFDRDDMPLAECLRRLRVLTALGDGVLCHDKTWGFGVVRHLDDFYKKVTIDFDRRTGHQMSFEYAGETLELIDDAHLMARRFRDPEGLAELVRNDAAQVVRIALTSFGAMSVPALQELLAPTIVAEADWKRFWSDARKVLKADPLVDVPAKRNDPIALRSSAKAFDEDWFAALREERDMDRIVALLTEWEQEGDGAEALSGAQRVVVSERMGFCVRGSEWQRADRVAWFLMLAGRLGFRELPEGGDDSLAWSMTVDDTTRRLLEPELFIAALTGLAARDIEPFLKYMLAFDAVSTCNLVLDVLPRLSLVSLKAAIDQLVAESRQDDCAARLGNLFRDQEAGPTLVYWACSNLEQMESWSVMTLPNLLAVAIDMLGGEHSGENLRASNQLEGLFEDRAWLERVFGTIDATNRRSLLKRVQSMRGIEAVQRRSIMARVIKLFPELEQDLTQEPEDGASGRRVRYTSWRSYNRRREELKILVDDLIPANSREIAVARSYGDLSENHEYKAAKEHQGILLRRKGEMEKELREVQGTDFKDFAAEKAGMGACVDVTRPDGSVQRFCILGEWDGDQALGIISSQSRLAQLLEGHGVGEEVRLPAAGAMAGTDDGELCVITAIGKPDDAIRAYLAAT